MPYTGRLQVAGLAKESVPGTFVAPTRFVNFLPPFDFSDDIVLLEGKGVQGLADEVLKVAQGPAHLKAGKLKLEVEPENIGEQLMGAFGTDTMTETASLTVVTGTNDTIDFNIGGGNLVATVAAGTYVAGQTQADTGSLCQLIYAAITGAEGAGTYTVSYSRTTQKFTITRSAGTFQMKFLTGPNNAKTMALLIGFTKTDQTGALTYTGANSVTPPFSHLFTRVASALLPSYSWWQQAGPDYPEFAGCMLNKLTIDCKAKEFIMAEAEWIGMKYVAGGTSKATTFSPLNPFKFDQAVISVAGTPVNDYEDVRIEIDNAVEAVHVVGNTINATKIYARHFKVSITATLIVENTTEWAKFIAGTTTSFTITITSAQMVNGTVPYSLTLTIPTVAYKAAPRPIPQDLIKITFTADAVYNTGSTLTMSAALVNSVSASY